MKSNNFADSDYKDDYLQTVAFTDGSILFTAHEEGGDSPIHACIKLTREDKMELAKWILREDYNLRTGVQS